MPENSEAVLALIALSLVAAGCAGAEPMPTPAAMPTGTPMPPLTGSGGGVIAFASDRNGGDWEIYVMNADGSEQRRLTSRPRTDQRPAWSPDGAWIAFTSRRKGSEDIFVMRPDGTDVHRLTTDGSNEFAPAWSPDGTRIVFVCDRDRDTELYVLSVQEALQDADACTHLQLTDNDAQDDNPNWSPATAGRAGL